MKQKLLNKFWLRVGMIVAVMTTALSGTVMADEYTIGWGSATGAEGSFTNFTANSGTVNGLLSFSTSKNSSLNEPLYSSSGKDLRLYYGSNGDGGSLTFALVSGVTITGFELTTTSTTYTPTIKYTVDLEASESVTTSTTIYTVTDISATSSLKIQNANTTNTQLRIKTIKISYTISGDTPTTYNVTFDAGDGTFVGNTDFPNASNTVAAGTYTLPSATRDGYTFDGWQTTGSTELITGSYTVSDNIDFTASYTQNSSSEGGKATLTCSNLELTGSYTTNTSKTIDGITYIFTDLMKNSDNIQAKASSGTIKNTTAYPGDITSVVITHSGTARATTINGSADGENWTQVATGSGSINADFSGKGYKYFQITRGSNAAYWEKIDINYSTTTSDLEQSDLAITNTSTTLAFDLYNNSTAQVISYTTSSTGAITITPESPTDYFSYVHDATNKTITVTPLAVTPSVQTVTIAQEPDDDYYGGSATFTVSVVNSDPNAPGSENNPYTVAQARAAIDANTGTQGVYATGIVSAIPTAWSSQYNNITFNFVDAEGDTDFLQAYRCVSTDAADASTVAVGDIVVVKGNLTKYGTTYEFAQNCELVSLTHSTNPVIIAEDASITYDVTYYELLYSIENPIDGAVLSATTDATWITSLTPSTKSFDRVMIECEANESTEDRTATITLSYPGATDKVVTITQAAYVAPFVVEDGVFDFVQAASKNENYGSGIEPTTDGQHYETEASTWTAGNVTLVASGKYRWWSNDGTLRFYANTPTSAMTISVPEGNVITKIVITGGQAFAADCGNYSSGNWTGYSNSVVLTSTSNSSVNVKTITVTYVEACQPATVTLNASGYATFASTSAVDFTNAETNGYSAWAVTAVSGSEITFSQITGAVAAGTGVLLKGTASDQVTIEYTTSGAAPAGNLLEGVVAPKAIELGQYYGLKGNTFVKVNTGTVPAGKALLPANVVEGTGDGDGVKTLTFSFDEDATAIETLSNSPLKGENIYNLAGQRLSKMQKGINIVNGRKVLY